MPTMSTRTLLAPTLALSVALVVAASALALRPVPRVPRLALGAAALPLAVVLLPVMVLGDSSVTVAAPAHEVTGIPASYLHWYVVGGRVCPQVTWNVLAGVGEVESGQGANMGFHAPGGRGIILPQVANAQRPTR